MGTKHVLSIDIGTSSLKAAVLDRDGAVHTQIRQRVMGPGDSIESFRVERWHDALERAIPRIVSGVRIDAIVLSGNGPTVVAVDQSGHAISPPLLWLDQREEHIPDARSFYLPKIAWFERHSPDANRVRWYLPFPEYLSFWMTGEAVATTPGPAFSDIIWNPADVERAGVDSGRLPPFARIGQAVGTLRADRADVLGLASEVPVFAGGSDFLMSLIGTDSLRDGETCDRAGTSEGINHCSQTHIDHPRLRTLPHVTAEHFNVAGILSSTGMLFEWFREISGQLNRDYSETMLDILETGSEHDRPWFFPSVHDESTWSFRRGMFIGLGAEHDRAAMGRAVVLSIGYAVREAVDTLGEAGCRVRELSACGGQAKNALWNQMKADIVGVPIRVPAVPDAELVGDLCAGLVGLGEFSTVHEAASHVVRFSRTFHPDQAAHGRYAETYGRYMERYARFRQALEDCM